MKVYWHGSPEKPNFGDAITPFIFRSISGQDPERADFSDKDKILCCGSIIEATKDGDMVWGSGAIIPEQIINHPAKYICHMARGYLSRDLIRQKGIDVPDFACDPAVLIPHIFSPIVGNASIKHEVGIFPHACSFDRFTAPGFPVFDITTGVRETVSNISQCSAIITESLHVMVVAEALGIPTVFMVTSDHNYDFTWKFRDYYSTTGRDFVEPVRWTDGLHLDNIFYAWHPPKALDYKQLFLSCPFNMRSITNIKELIVEE